MALNRTQHEFHMEEYRQLRAEATTMLGRIETLLRYSLVVSAAVYAWLVVQSVGFVDNAGKTYSCLRLPNELLVYGWLIPPLFVVLTGLGAAVTRVRVGQMGAYLCKLEKEMGLSQTLGWEGFLQSRSSVVTGTAIGVWVLILVATVVFSAKGVCVTQPIASVACPVKAS